MTAELDYEIVPITEELIAGFRDALDVVCREEKYLTFTEAPPLEKSQEYVRGNIANNYTHLVVIADGKVVGWCDVVGAGRPTKKHIGTLGIGLIPAWRGKGVGERLMRAAIADAQSKGITRIELTVYEPNQNAAALYKKLGFETEGLLRKGVCLKGEYHNVIPMALLS